MLIYQRVTVLNIQKTLWKINELTLPNIINRNNYKKVIYSCICTVEANEKHILKQQPFHISNVVANGGKSLYEK